MPVLDFCEIAEAHLASGHQDRFELFARDFLEYFGYTIAEGPSRGADGGKDLIVLDVRKGVGGETNVRWLVSCKHKAHSKKSVTIEDELNIIERVRAHNCTAFLGFYSTLPSSALATRFDALRKEIETNWFDHEQIECRLLRSSAGLELARRYFPKSLDAWGNANPRPPKIFDETEPLKCDYCEKILLDPATDLYPQVRNSIITFWKQGDPENAYNYETQIVDIYWSCKGNCDRQLGHSYRERGLRFDGWEDIPDVCIPIVYVKWIMACLNNIRDGRYSAEAIEKLKDFMIIVFHFVARAPIKGEDDRIQALLRIPPYLGGL
jgi:hypothetical protein